MARTKENASDLPIDEETLGVLEDQVKKGKARKFILICKGVQIKKLIVFKKGPFGTRIQKAKKEGFRGTAVCGVVTGSGVDLSFQLAGSPEVAGAMGVDGTVDKEPTKAMKLKEFLAENKLKRKPSYKIISDVAEMGNPEADDEADAGGNGAATATADEAPDQAGGTKTQADAFPSEAAAESVAPSGGAEPADGELEAKCKQLKSAVAPKVQEAAAKNPASKDELVRLLQSASELEKAGSWGEAFEVLKQLVAAVKAALAGSAPAGPEAAAAEADPNQAKIDAYEKELKAIKKLVAALEKHTQHAHIAGELTEIRSELGKADTAYKAKNFADAMAALAKAKETAGKAQGFADKYAAYVKKRGAAQYTVESFKDLLGNTDSATYTAEITAADNLAKPATRDYSGATAKIEAVITGSGTKLRTKLTGWYVTSNEPKIVALKAGAAKTFLADRIKAIDAAMKEVKANIAAGEYHKARPNGWKLNELVRVAAMTSDRRGAFDTQRPKTVTAIEGLKNFKALDPEMAKLNERLKAADEQASLKSRQFENAVEALTKIAADATALATNGPAAETYAAERKVVETAFEALSKHEGAAGQKPLIEGIKAKLDQAAELAKDVTKMAAANTELGRAKRDIDGAKQALDEAGAVGVVADSAKDAESGKKALDALKISLAAAKKHKHAGDIPKDFTAIDEKVTSAESDLKDPKKADKALDTIKKIGDELAQVMVRLGQQEGYGVDRAALEDRLTKLKALPEAEVIKAKIKPLEAALKDADTQNKSEAWDKRAEAMTKARDAAEEAEETAEQSKLYATRQQKLETTVAASSLSDADKKKVTDAIKPAAAKAKSLKYDEATKALVQAEGNYETLLVNGFAKQDPPDLAKIEAAAKRMMKNGNAKAIDALIQKLPDATKHDVLKTLAKERFGIELKSDPGEATKSAKAMLEMLAKVPDDVVGNPSLKTLERREPAKDGGFYRGRDQLVVMNGRPGQADQEFGAAIADELPADVEDDCKPKSDAAVDYFDFATLHEVGHSVDDNLQFMASREGKSEFGGWKSYAGNIDPIVQAVADWTGYNSTDEQKKAISDLILRNKVTWPTPPAGKEAEWDAAKTKVTKWYGIATDENVWWSQADSAKIDINGTVYHEAYKSDWISYEMKARKQGLTGYQFRAPGEWFAELYAAYHMDKLKSSHPAVKWLSNIKV